MALAGGAVLTRRFVVTPPLAVTDVWRYPDVGGHVAATATYAGSLLGPPVLVGTTKHSYTPDGTGPPPDNSDGDYDYGWLGSHQRPTDHGLPTTIVQMGARPYAPSLGRFLSVDPIEGGSCNDYDYVCGDPVNGLDLTGTHCSWRHPHHCAGAAVRAVVDYATAGDLKRQDRESYECNCTVENTNPIARAEKVYAERYADDTLRVVAAAAAVALPAVGAPAAAAIAVPVVVSTAGNLVDPACSTAFVATGGTASSFSSTATAAIYHFADSPIAGAAKGLGVTASVVTSLIPCN